MKCCLWGQHLLDPKKKNNIKDFKVHNEKMGLHTELFKGHPVDFTVTVKITKNLFKMFSSSLNFQLTQ
jgi:hypothetical protein